MNIRVLTIVTWILRLVAAFIMLQTLFFKFTASEESIYIFSTLGIEPWGRIATGILELIASVLILFPKTTAVGAILGMGIMGGAIFTHLTKLGIEVKNDGGLLFIYALIVFFSCLVLTFIHRNTLFQFIRAVISR